ncbi:hypothetical protein [Iningainema tapete]|uniref:Uncharacterized protein n=1 Tax=Iningainema tapete BLCC-T55 TaxID=2748662 RepID=A0A8J6XL18_9CYAN|nr:hypothetical protein [Iningainema tapete]MBD2778239.1 hypothetical protein [Iningainema tapete BLCC-T55]
MFDPRQTQIQESYLATLSSTEKALLSISKAFVYAVTEITKEILDRLKEAHSASKIAVEVGQDTYNLVPDESTPRAYKWEKVDLTNPLEPKVINDGVSAELTDYQAQTIGARLVEDVPDLGNNYQQSGESPLRITAYIESEGSDKQIVIYEQNSEGKCTTNLVTETLTQDEIMKIASEPLVKLLPPSAEIIKNSEGRQELLNSENLTTETDNTIENQTRQIEENLSAVADNMLSELLNENNNQVKPEVEPEAVSYYESDEYTVGFLDDIDISNPPDVDLPPDNYEEFNYRAYAEQNSSSAVSVTSEEVNQVQSVESAETNELVETVDFEAVFVKAENQATDNLEQETPSVEQTPRTQKEVEVEEVSNNKLSQKKVEEVEENSTRNQFFTPEEELETTYAPQYTYQEVANSQGVEPAAQQWARQVEVPIYQINNKQAREERYKGENKNIAETATAILKKYGTVEQDGSRIYRSDAFVIRLEGDTIGIHRRSDELSGWENSLMEFKLNKKEEPKITKKPTQMLPVERQEFLMVAEHLNDNGKLPDLSSADIRDVANSLGSLAPAGTIKTLEVFKQNEILLTLNNVLIQADKEELTVGEFTIKRSRDPENNRASLQLFKTTEEKGTQELVRFDLTKTEAGITKEVSKMNISDYDINQVKFIAQNAQKLNLEQIFGNEQPTASAAPPKEQPIQTAGDIPVKVHPYIAEEWANMVKHGGPDWGGAMNQGNEEILLRIKDNSGKLPIADQREMYFKVMTYKATVAEKQGENTMEFVPLKDIMQDLQQWRGEEILQQYTPTENIPFPQRQTVTTAAAAPKAKSGGVEL